MPYCPECGKEVSEGDEFCPRCGAPLKAPAIRYRRPGRGWPVGRILAAVFGSLIIIVSFGLLAGGGGIMWVQGTFGDTDGFLVSREVGFRSDTHAIVLKEVDIDVDIPTRIWRPGIDELVTVKIVGTSSDPAKNIFIGIARDPQASAYLGGVGYDEVTDFSWPYGPLGESPPEITYRPHPGSAPPQPPTVQGFWVASASGAEAQVLEWEPQTGVYWVVVMNDDGSAGVDFDLQLRARVPILRTVGNALVAGGIITLAVGAFIFYYGVIRRP